MKKKIKRYLAFATVPYRVLAFAVVPVVMISMYLLMRKNMAEFGIVAIMISCAMIEILMDNFLFGGLHKKEHRMLEYLKTSECGKGVLRDVLEVDLLRRLLAFVSVLGICALLEMQRWSHVRVIFVHLFYMLLSYTLSTLGIWIGRFEGNYWTNMLIGYAALAFGVAAYFLPELNRLAVLYDVVLALAAVGVSVLSVRTAMKKMEGSYYDT